MGKKGQISQAGKFQMIYVDTPTSGGVTLPLNCGLHVVISFQGVQDTKVKKE